VDAAWSAQADLAASGSLAAISIATDVAKNENALPSGRLAQPARHFSVGVRLILM